MKKKTIQPSIADLADLMRKRATEPGVANLYNNLYSLVSEINARLGLDLSIEPLDRAWPAQRQEYRKIG